MERSSQVTLMESGFLENGAKSQEQPRPEPVHGTKRNENSNDIKLNMFKNYHVKYSTKRDHCIVEVKNTDLCLLREPIFPQTGGGQHGPTRFLPLFLGQLLYQYMCVSLIEMEGGREGGRERERERKGCICIYIYMPCLSARRRKEPLWSSSWAPNVTKLAVGRTRRSWLIYRRHLSGS